MKNLDLFVACHLMLSLAACSSTGVTYYADQLPELVLEDFFDGNLEAYGVVKDWRGRVIRKFEADIIAYWDRGVGTLDVKIDNRMYLVTPDVLINESRMSKFGIPVGDFLLVIEKKIINSSPNLPYNTMFVRSQQLTSRPKPLTQFWFRYRCSKLITKVSCQP